MEAIMNLKDHHTTQELKALYRIEKDARLARRIHGVYLAAKGLNCTQIMTITGAARRTIQQFVGCANSVFAHAAKNRVCNEP
jgi:hypothetical protein